MFRVERKDKSAIPEWTFTLKTFSLWRPFFNVSNDFIYGLAHAGRTSPSELSCILLQVVSD